MDNTDWTLGADQGCAECGGSGQSLVEEHGEVRTYALCHCWQSWRIGPRIDARLRAEAEQRFEEAKRRWDWLVGR